MVARNAFSLIPMSNPVYASPHEGLRGAHAGGMSQSVPDVDPAAVNAAVPVSQISTTPVADYAPAPEII